MTFVLLAMETIALQHRWSDEVLGKVNEKPVEAFSHFVSKVCSRWLDTTTTTTVAGIRGDHVPHANHIRAMFVNGERIAIARQAVHLVGMEIVARAPPTVTCEDEIEAVVDPGNVATTMITTNTVGNAITTRTTALTTRLAVVPDRTGILGIPTITVTVTLTSDLLHVGTTMIDTAVLVAARDLATMRKRQDVGVEVESAQLGAR